MGKRIYEHGMGLTGDADPAEHLPPDFNQDAFAKMQHLEL
jgi:hypothetical protein